MGTPADPIDALLGQQALHFGPHVALVGDESARPGEAITYADLQLKTEILAGGLERLGLVRGDAIALWLPNSPAWLLLHFAAARVGLLTIPINTWCRESEVSHLVGLGRCRAIVMESDFLGIDFEGILDASLRAIRSKGDDTLKTVIDVSGGSAGSAGSAGATSCAGLPRVLLVELFANTESDIDREPTGHSTTSGKPAMIAFSTSGTTSAPKLAVHGDGVLLSHAQAVAQTARMTPDDVVLAALPPCGAYGHGLILAALSAGATAILVREYAVERIVNAIESEQVTVMALTEPLLKKILDHAAAHRKSLRSLRIVFSAGGTLQPVVERAEAEFGFRITNVYGSSEVLALAAFWGFDGSAAERSAAGGRLVSAGMRVRAVDSAGIPVTPGMPGELQFAGPVVTSGYLVNEAATRNAFTTDGWFKSGDLGSVDDESGRRFHYVARLNDALRLKGFLVNPGEIEEMLQSHPDVSAAQVVGLSEKSGEDLAAAFVVLRPHASADADALRTFCRARMASYKVPTLLEIVPKFPMTRSANGDKVMKNRLRDMAQEMLTNE